MKTVLKIVLGIVIAFVLLAAGCAALIGGVANEVDKEIKESEKNEKPRDIAVGEAFEVSDFEYAAGWSLGKDTFGDAEVTGLKVTNNRDEKDSAIVEIKLWQGTEVLALVDCHTDQIDVGSTVSVSCHSSDKLPKKYDRVTINDTF